jgi:hypothetical protein
MRAPMDGFTACPEKAGHLPGGVGMSNVKWGNGWVYQHYSSWFSKASMTLSCHSP